MGLSCTKIMSKRRRSSSPDEERRGRPNVVLLRVAKLSSSGADEEQPPPPPPPRKKPWKNWMEELDGSCYMRSPSTDPTPNVVDMLLGDGRGVEPVCQILHYLCGEDLRKVKCVKSQWHAKLRRMWTDAADRNVFELQTWYRCERWKYAETRMRAPPAIDLTCLEGINIVRSVKADDRDIFCVTTRHHPPAGDISICVNVFDRVSRQLKRTLSHHVFDVDDLLAFSDKIIITVRDRSDMLNDGQVVAYKKCMTPIPILGMGSTEEFVQPDSVKGLGILQDQAVVGFSDASVAIFKVSDDLSKLQLAKLLVPHMNFKIDLVRFQNLNFLAQMKIGQQAPRHIMFSAHIDDNEFGSFRVLDSVNTVKRLVYRHPHALIHCIVPITVSGEQSLKSELQLWNMGEVTCDKINTIETDEQMEDVCFNDDVLAVGFSPPNVAGSPPSSDNSWISLWSMQRALDANADGEQMQPFRKVVLPIILGKFHLEKSRLIVSSVCDEIYEYAF